jgi:poly(A) polymerase
MTAPAPQAIAKTIVQRLQAGGFSAFWVGGCVRDFLLGREPGDIDIATDATPEQVEKLFAKTIPVGKKFGVVIVVEGDLQSQVATFRAEAEYRDGRRPEQVVFANAQADAVRRDFTINGLFYDPYTEKIHDWVGGQNDLKSRVVRTIGAPRERFGEDHLRMLRAVRFAARLDFQIEPETFTAIQALAARIELISAERIRDELVKIFAPPEAELSIAANAPAARGLVLLRDSGLLAHVLPEVSATIGCEQSPDFHPEGSVFNHLCLMLQKLPPGADESLPWAVLMHDIAKPATAERDGVTGAIHFYGHEKVGAEMAERILQRLRFPKKQIDEIVACVRYHMQFKDVKLMRKSTLRRMLLRDTFPLELALHRLDALGSSGSLEHYDFLVAQMAELKDQPALRPPLLNGHDLLALGIPAGKRLGEWLHEVRERQLADELKTPEEARRWLQKNLSGHE